MSAVRFPVFPVSQFVEYWLGDEKIEDDLLDIRWEKIPTQHQFTVYRGTAYIANASLLSTIALVTASVTACLPPMTGAITSLFSFWMHASATISCKHLISKIEDPLIGSIVDLDPKEAAGWKNGRFQCLQLISWHCNLPTIDQIALDSLPKSLGALVKQTPSQNRNLTREIKEAWLRVHERNRLCLREWFNTKSAQFIGEDHDRLLENLCQKHLIDITAQFFLEGPRTRREIHEFLKRSTNRVSALETVTEGEDMV